MKICEQLKTNLGELFFLQQQLTESLAVQDYDTAKKVSTIMRGIIIEMSEPLDWAEKAKIDIRTFLKDYLSAKLANQHNHKWGIGETWKLADALKKYCKIDIENRKTIISTDIKPETYQIALPNSLIIKGDLYIVEWLEIPDDLIVEGNAVLPIISGDKLRQQLLTMQKRGQIKGHVVNAT